MSIVGGRTPATGIIFGVPMPPIIGTSPEASAPGNFGVDGPGIGSLSDLEARGSNGRFQRNAAAFFNYGNPPIESTTIELPTVPIIARYETSGLNDGADLRLMPEMPIFVVREMDPDTRSDIILSLADVNKLMRDQWNDFVLYTTADPNPQRDPEAVEFLVWLREFGESALESYARAHRRNDQHALAKWSDEMKQFFQRATMPGYCFLTRYGILQRLNFLGFIEATSRDVGLEPNMLSEWEEHKVALGVALAKRTRVSNIFGDATKTPASSRLWICLTRLHCGNGQYGCFVLKPMASPHLNVPLRPQTHYIDEAGILCPGYAWSLGYVLENSARSPQPSAVDAANGTGPASNPQRAYEMHGMLPSMYIALGVKN